MNVTQFLLRTGIDRKAFDKQVEEIVALLDRSDRAVEQAIVRIYDRQTQDEKQTESTNHLNGIGFQACDARRGTYWARLILSGRHLFADRMPKARAMAKKYRVQLACLAVEKRIAKIAERKLRLDRMSDAATFCPEDLEAEMRAMEAEGDRAQARREEQAKAAWKARVER